MSLNRTLELAARRLTPARSKYRAKPQVVDGIRFHSQAEARRYGELKLLEKAGEISRLVLQPAFLLLVYSIPFNDHSMILGKYIADFQYVDRNGITVVEDVKGVSTALYKWKKRHVEKQYNIQIVEVR